MRKRLSMELLWIILIIVGALILWGPIMLFFAKINKVDPYILDKGEEDILKDERSFTIVSVFGPLFTPLWIETKILRWVGIIKK